MKYQQIYNEQIMKMSLKSQKRKTKYTISKNVSIYNQLISRFQAKNPKIGMRLTLPVVLLVSLGIACM